MYRVHWRSKITGHTGRGEPMSKRDAEAHVKRANADRSVSDIEHWIEPD